MESGLWGQCETNCHVVDELDDAVGPVELRTELAGGGLGKRCRCTMPKTKEDPVAHLKGDRAMRPIVVTLLHRLGLLQPMANVLQELGTLFHGLGHDSDPRLARLIRPN
jgi:hypothetical protein